MIFKPFSPPAPRAAPRALSPQQAAAVSVVTSALRGFAVEVDSRAGSGKTTTLVAAVRALPRGSRVLVLVYNKAIQTELQGKLPAGTTVLTYHAYARKVLAATGLDFTVPSPGYAPPSWVWVKAHVQTNLRRMVVQAASVFRNLALPLVEETPSDAELIETLQDFAVRLPKIPAQRVKVVQWAKQLLAETDAAVDSALAEPPAPVKMSVMRRLSNPDDEPRGPVRLEFDDLLWLAPKYGNWEHPEERYTHVFVDEAQDTCPAQAYLLAGAATAGNDVPATLVVVGDPYQAINGWRAAGRGPLDAVVDRVGGLLGVDFPLTRAPLTVSWRCPRKHVLLAAMRRPIEAAPDAIEGEVAFGKYEEAPTFVLPGDAVLSRTNAPLIDLALRLLAAGRSVHFPGSDVLGSTRDLISSIASSENVTLDKLRVILSNRLADLYKIPEDERLREHDDEIDKYSVALRLATELRSLDDLDDLLARFASQDPNAVQLLSIHRAKGKEWDRVVLYGFEAKRRQNLPTWLQEQETNVSYVGLTRSKRWMGFLESEHGQGYPRDIMEKVALWSRAPACSV